MSRLPPELTGADELTVLESLHRLIEDGRISSCQARSTWTAYRVAQSEASDVQPYLSVEIRRTQPTQPINE